MSWWMGPERYEMQKCQIEVAYELENSSKSTGTVESVDESAPCCRFPVPILYSGAPLIRHRFQLDISPRFSEQIHLSCTVSPSRLHPPPSLEKLIAAMRSIIRPARAIGRRFNSTSSSSSTSNPQVQKAVEGAQKAYQQSAAVVSRVAGPVGQRITSALGSESRNPQLYTLMAPNAASAPRPA
jgi:hypothetical protein